MLNILLLSIFNTVPLKKRLFIQSGYFDTERFTREDESQFGKWLKDNR